MEILWKRHTYLAFASSLLWSATCVLYPSSGTFLPFFCYLLLPNKLPQNLVAWEVIYFSQLWVGSSPLGLAGLTLGVALSSWWGREVRESLTPVLRVSVLALLLHVASRIPGGQISFFTVRWSQGSQSCEGKAARLLKA